MIVLSIVRQVSQYLFVNGTAAGKDIPAVSVVSEFTVALRDDQGFEQHFWAALDDTDFYVCVCWLMGQLTLQCVMNVVADERSTEIFLAADVVFCRTGSFVVSHGPCFTLSLANLLLSCSSCALCRKFTQQLCSNRISII